MADVLEALEAQLDELAELLAGLDETEWAAPTRCEGWDVADVVIHLAQTNDLATLSAQGASLDAWGGGDVDAAAAAAVEATRGAAGDEVREQWQTSADTMLGALRAADPSARVNWVMGQLSARTLATTRLAESWIHTGDVAAALGRTPAATDRLWHIARLAWRTLPYAFERAGRSLTGAVAVELRAPDGTTWRFTDEGAEAHTTVRGDALDFCLVAGRRAEPETTTLTAEGPDGPAVLELVRTYA